MAHIIDHGSPGNQSIGDGNSFEPGKHINGRQEGQGKADRDRFVNGVKGKVSSLRIMGCSVAEGKEGEEFIKLLSAELNVSVTALTGACYSPKHTKYIPIIGSVYKTWYEWTGSNHGIEATASPDGTITYKRY